MKFHAQLLKQGFNNSKEPLVREKNLPPGEGNSLTITPPVLQPGLGCRLHPGEAVAAKAQAQTFLWSHRAWLGHSSHSHFEGAAFLSVQLLLVTALLLRQLNAFDCLKGFTAALKSQCNER